MGSRDDKRLGGRSAEMESVPLKAYQYRQDKIYAVKVDQENVLETAIWCGGQLVDEINPLDDNDRRKGINVPTTRGIMRASDGSYVVKNVVGQLEVHDGAYFESLMEEA